MIDEDKKLTAADWLAEAQGWMEASQEGVESVSKAIKDGNLALTTVRIAGVHAAAQQATACGVCAVAALLIENQ